MQFRPFGISLALIVLLVTLSSCDALFDPVGDTGDDIGDTGGGGTGGGGTGGGGTGGGGVDGGGTSQQGQLSFWVGADFGSVSITVDGQPAGSLTQFFNGVTPACGQAGTVTVSRLVGTAQIVAVAADGTRWEGTQTVQGGRCSLVQLTGTPSGGGGGSGTYSGGWRRYNNPNGYITDLQVGGISGQPANRVYMCTLPPTPSPGLFKGTLQSDGVTIRWDAAYSIPDYEIQPTGSNTMQLYVPSVGSVGGSYQRGTWRPGSCGLNL